MEREEKNLMDFKSPQCPYTVTVRRNPPRRAKKTPATTAPGGATPSSTQFGPKGVSRFPIEDILQCEVPSSTTSIAENCENLRVFLRIRPLEIKKNLKKHGDGAIIARSRLKGVSPKQELKKKTKKKEICLSVIDTQSVTLSPPQSMQGRVKTELYDGFTHVFDSDSLQNEVYDRVMDPLVSNFIAGKSGMLAAMGPTGSGKTHTVFGSNREPGMVPLALQKIFSCTGNSFTSEVARSYYISIFEIYSERKGEKILDLSLDGVDACRPQSTIKGLQEVLVSNAVEAQAVILRGIAKRATAMTNSNSQSSRSQCIINIRAAPITFDGNVEVVANTAVLTIVDLAGAEKEKKTGNQGARLLESNFINNTSMVFGLCLRSLLEHQQNPKKQLQKHFQNSLVRLTRYLRDYLEGKKRMALILTVKPTDDDYLDTSFLLKQAAPIMKIKFSTVEEQSTLPKQKRNTERWPRVEQQPKRRKLRTADASEINEDKIASNEIPFVEEGCETVNCAKSEMHNSSHHKEACCIELTRIRRRENIMQNFSKALWHVLKQYKQRVQESEIEIQTLKANLREENVRNLNLEKEMKDLKARSCTHQSTEASSGLQGGSDSLFVTSGLPQLAVHNSDTLHKVGVESVDVCSPDPKTCECNQEKRDMVEEPSQEVLFQVQVPDIASDDCLSVKDLKEQDYQVQVPDIASDDCLSVKDFKEQDYQVYTSPTQPMNRNSKSFPEKQNDVKDCLSIGIQVSDIVRDDCLSIKGLKEQDYQASTPTQPMNRNSKSFSEEENDVNDLTDLKYLDVKDTSNPDIAGTGLGLLVSLASSSRSRVLVGDGKCPPMERKTETFSDTRVSLNDEVGYVDARNVRESEQERCSPRKSSNVVKPRRRLLPASSVLLKEINGLNLEAENVEPKGSRGGRKLFAEERKLTQGSVSLLRLLKTNHHL